MIKYSKSGVLDLRQTESGNVALFSYDTKTLREDAQGLPQRSEGTQTQRELPLKSDAFAAQNPALQDFIYTDFLENSVGSEAG